MFNFFKKKPQPVATPKKVDLSKFVHHAPPMMSWDEMLATQIRRDGSEDIRHDNGTAMDSAPVGFGVKNGFQGGQNTVPNSLISWYGVQSFIGNQLSSILSQHWLIYKCCNMPARDAIRKGYEVTINDGTDVDTKVLDAIRKADSRYLVNKNLEEFITMGRVFGIRVVMFEVESKDPKYYELPFNIDGVTPGSYKGIIQIDPYWITPLLDADAAANPMTKHFYEPTWWQVNGRRIHRTHLIVFINGFLADILKPTYLYGGVSVPQKIYERVYCAERTANEAPQLALTKRTMVQKTDLSQAAAKPYEFEMRARLAADYQSNYGTKFIGEDDEVMHFDTSLADLDAVIMTQYQLVAAAANVPSTKLLGTSPKGFNSSGSHEESSYHEELESIQNSDLTPLLERHHMLLIRSEICPKFGIAPFETSVSWATLDSVNAVELAAINKTKAETGQALMVSGAIDAEDERQRIINDPHSGYNGVIDEESELATGAGDPENDPFGPPELEENVRSEPDDEPE